MKATTALNWFVRLLSYLLPPLFLFRLYRKYQHGTPDGVMFGSDAILKVAILATIIYVLCIITIPVIMVRHAEGGHPSQAWGMAWYVYGSWAAYMMCWNFWADLRAAEHNEKQQHTLQLNSVTS